MAASGSVFTATGGRTLNIAHRGARSLAPENTLAAAKKALEIGADMWELDVGMTADGHLVVIHDAGLIRTSNARTIYPERSPWWVHDFSLEELLRLDFGSWFGEQDPFGQIAAGKVSHDIVRSYRGEKLPTLREALEFTLANDWLVNVEIKDLSGTVGDSEVVERVVALVTTLGATERVIVSSFNEDYLRRAKLADRRVITGWLVSTRRTKVLATLRRLDAQSYHPRIEALEMSAIRPLQAHGFKVLVWGELDGEAMQALIAAGANGIFSDFPQELARLLKQSGARDNEPS